MAKTKFDTAEAKKRLQERAEKLKPKVVGVIATERGWAVAQPNGTLELLVSYGGLDALLGDVTPEFVGEPIDFILPTETPEVAFQPEVTEAPKEEVKVEETPAEEPKVEEPEVAPKKKPGRPKAEKSAEEAKAAE